MEDEFTNGTELYGRGGGSPAEVWGYGFLFVTIINMSAFAGVWVIPIMNKQMYKKVLMFLVSLAVGTLSGSALLSLIPEALGLRLEGDHDYTWKSTVVLSGIYLFFVTERVLKMIGSSRRERARRRKQQVKKQPSVQVTAMHKLDYDPDRIGYKFTSPTEAMAMTDARESIEAHRNIEDSPSSAYLMELQSDEVSSGGDVCSHGHTHNSPQSSVIDNEQSNGGSNGNHDNKHDNRYHGLTDGDNNHKNSHGHSHVQFVEGDNMIATVAYMIIFGDGLHNFIDGLAIGASFSNSIYQGISTSVAVICEEFPHELGDFAILLNSGMSVKHAILANFLSACTCYLGLIIGIVLGENFHASEWIFALAGGMFLYISLVDMLPEINNVGDGDPSHKDQRSIQIFLIQNAGLLTGLGIILVLDLFAEEIKF